MTSITPVRFGTLFRLNLPDRTVITPKNEQALQDKVSLEDVAELDRAFNEERDFPVYLFRVDGADIYCATGETYDVLDLVEDQASLPASTNRPPGEINLSNLASTQLERLLPGFLKLAVRLSIDPEDLPESP